jgi:hypothetical protein
MRRRTAVEPVIGHLKNDDRMDRNYLHHRSGDATNAILAAIGDNFSLLLRWLRLLLRLIRSCSTRNSQEFDPTHGFQKSVPPNWTQRQNFFSAFSNPCW